MLDTSSVLVKAQNVLRYFYEHGKEQGWDDLNTFPCCKPPFERMVISYDAASFDENKKRLSDIHTDVTVRELPPDGLITNDEVAFADARKILQGMNPDKLLMFQTALEGVEIENFIVIGIDKTGKVLSDQQGNSYIYVKTRRWTNEHFVHILHRDTVISLGTINFMNCRNVEITDHQPTRQQKRYSERTGTPLPTVYKTLQIQPVQKRHIAGPHLPHEDKDIALHIVRGHFKDYRQGTGLGKLHLKGMWWWHPQLRGVVEKGVVVKDYEVVNKE